MQSVILGLQITSGILLAILILLQNRGSGLSGAAFGNLGGGSFTSTKRGAEKVISNLTVVLAIAFVVLSFISSVI